MKRLLPLVLLVLVGCGPGAAKPEQVTGDWRVIEMKLPPEFQKGQDAAAEAMRYYGSATLVVNPGKTYKLVVGPETTEGKWEIDGRVLTLTPVTVNGKPVVPAGDGIHAPIPLTLSNDGKTLASTQDGPNLVFSK